MGFGELFLLAVGVSMDAFAVSICKGNEPPINDTETYNNNVKVVPSFLCEPVAATVDDIQTLLIDSGYYTEADLK